MALVKKKKRHIQFNGIENPDINICRYTRLISKIYTQAKTMY